MLTLLQISERIAKKRRNTWFSDSILVLPLNVQQKTVYLTIYRNFLSIIVLFYVREKIFYEFSDFFVIFVKFTKEKI